MEDYNREDILDRDGMIRYFAYENNMCVKSMALKCPSAVMLGVSKLVNHRFIINEQGMATVIPKAASTVFGILWLLNETDETKLDRDKKITEGPYVKSIREIETVKGKTTKAMTYVSTNFMYGLPGRGYIDEILINAAKHHLPKLYVNEIKKWAKAENRSDKDETALLSD
jgi:hypothetical protein